MGDRPTVTINAGYNTKQRQLVDVALRPDTASEIRSLLASKLPTTPAFNLPRPERVVYMLREDLEVAGIAYRDETGRVCDFHSLRHTCGTLLAAAGVHPKVIQRVMRHSTITLTMDRYTHAFKSDEAEAIQKLPNLSKLCGVSRSATGTLGPNDPESLALKRGAIRGATGGQQYTEMPPSVDSVMKETSPSPRASSDVSSGKKHSKDKDSSKRPRWDSNPRWLTPTDLQSAPRHAQPDKNKAFAIDQPFGGAHNGAQSQLEGSDLQRVVTAWAQLPKAVRVGIVAMVDAIS